jgi:predicted DNA-binding WGR domain protein
LIESRDCVIPSDHETNLLAVKTMTRRFEFVGGNSAKFWQVSTTACEMTARWGRLGTDGQSQTKGFPSTEAAEKEADKLIGQKIKKGYQEVAPV